eukprot:5408635-Amphidinium_carterae.1
MQKRTKVSKVNCSRLHGWLSSSPQRFSVHITAPASISREQKSFTSAHCAQSERAFLLKLSTFQTCRKSDERLVKSQSADAMIEIKA